MKLHLLGSGSAEGWPAPFCDCAACTRSRETGGRNIRTRSNAIVDSDLKIDWSADTLMQLQRDGVSLSGLRTILFTHEHADHVVPGELAWMLPPFSQTPPAAPVSIYANEVVCTLLRRAAGGELPAGIELHEIHPFTTLHIDESTVLTPLAADHTDKALVFRIERAGIVLFYGHDSGIYPEDTIEALQDGPALDIALFDCNNGPRESSNIGHMNIAGMRAVIERLRRRGAVHAQTRLVATHFSHNCAALHQELVDQLEPHGIETAYDGMIVSS